MTSMEDFRRMAAAIDQRVGQLTANGIKGVELLNRMVGHLPDLQRIWIGADDRQLSMLCREYPGFYEYASLMEGASEAQRAHPEQSRCKDLPVLKEPLRSKLAELLSDAAILEGRYQALITGGTRKEDTRIEKLSRLHRKWQSNRERFIEALKEAGLPESVSDFVVPTLEQMSDRIAMLEKRISGK